MAECASLHCPISNRRCIPLINHSQKSSIKVGTLTGVGKIGNARKQLKLFHDVPSGDSLNLVIWKRKPNNYGIMDFLTTANSTETIFYKGSRGLFTR